MKNITLKLLIYSLIIIFIFHLILKHILLQTEINNSSENFEKYNIGDNNISYCDNAPGNVNTLTDMKKDLLDFIDRNDELYDINNSITLPDSDINSKINLATDSNARLEREFW